jgi:hypothetical protein
LLQEGLGGGGCEETFSHHLENIVTPELHCPFQAALNGLLHWLYIQSAKSSFTCFNPTLQLLFKILMSGGTP